MESKRVVFLLPRSLLLFVIVSKDACKDLSPGTKLFLAYLKDSAMTTYLTYLTLEATVPHASLHVHLGLDLP